MWVRRSPLPLVIRTALPIWSSCCKCTSLKRRVYKLLQERFPAVSLKIDHQPSALWCFVPPFSAHHSNLAGKKKPLNDSPDLMPLGLTGEIEEILPISQLTAYLGYTPHHWLSLCCHNDLGLTLASSKKRQKKRRIRRRDTQWGVAPLCTGVHPSWVIKGLVLSDTYIHLQAVWLWPDRCADTQTHTG